MQWWVGDWLNYGERRWGEMYTQAVEVTGLTPDVLSNMKSVAARYDLPRRRGNLSFSAHQEVAYLSPAHADELLARAEAEGLSTREVRSLARQTKAAATVGASVAGGDSATEAKRYRSG